MMNSLKVERSKHIYASAAFAELVKDAVRFFNGTPVHSLPPSDAFAGAGVYALYYTGQHTAYKAYTTLNRLAYNAPIYVGKAVPKGWRQARISDNALSQSKELHARLREHARSIDAASNLAIEDFWCRFVIFEGDSSDMISTIEAALVKLNKPLWNTVVDGFGNHDPGKGRYEQAKSDWDVIHPGRAWAEKCKAGRSSIDKVMSRINDHFEQLSKVE